MLFQVNVLSLVTWYLSAVVFFHICIILSYVVMPLWVSPWNHSQTPVTVESHAWQMVFPTLRRVTLCFWCLPKSCFPSLSFYPVCSVDWFHPNLLILIFLHCYFVEFSSHCCLGLHACDTLSAPPGLPCVCELYSATGHSSCFKITFCLSLKCTQWGIFHLFPFFPYSCGY